MIKHSNYNLIYIYIFPSDYGVPAVVHSAEPEPKRPPFSRSLSNADVPAEEHGGESNSTS